ncbi:putative pectinesterase/pectinesterase inhibitor 22 [Vitis vinifera]|uniref:Putative pectinesterase/pectinesterase inhibitor 22 n=1 Tax=Vitis vinifera TaxID=29760 RepID=A0A438FLM0_VITVI|nr:putative pectinesterase/pectinesterase inhibitor 22 [Vitis vinifera]
MASPSILCILSDDILARIRSKLSSELDRKTWRLVCRDFLRVDSACRTSLRVLRTEFLPGLLQKCRNMESLDLSVCPRINDAMVAILLGRGSVCWTRGLRRLVLSRATGLKSAGLELLTRSCPSLEAVDMSYCCGFGDREASALSCAVGLRELKLDKCLGVTDVGLATIAVGCNKLQRLSLKWCMELTDLGIDLLVKKCSDFEVSRYFLSSAWFYLFYVKIDVYANFQVTSESLRSIASLQKLEGLAMSGCSLVGDLGLHFLGNGCPSLLVIDVSRCDGVSSSGLISLIRGHSDLQQLNAGYSFPELSKMFFRQLKDMKDLNSIKVDGARVSDFSFQIISANCKCLVEIGLSKCMGVTDLGIMQLVSGCLNLKIVNLTCCCFITDAAISAVADSCRNLLCLKLESCNLITEKSLDQLGSCCLLLEELDLTDCSGVNDRGLEYLSRCSELTCLKLGLCANISDKGLFYIASNCKKLRELDLYRCNSIGNDELAALSSGCKKLEKLNLSYCSEVTDTGMEYISQLKELSDLELRGLVKITSTGLTAVAAGCMRLAELDLKHCQKIKDSGFWALAYYSRNLRQVWLTIIKLEYEILSNKIKDEKAGHQSCSSAVVSFGNEPEVLSSSLYGVQVVSWYSDDKPEQLYCIKYGLCMVMGNLTRLQDAKLVHLSNVTVDGFELALRASCIRLKRVPENQSLVWSTIRESFQSLEKKQSRKEYETKLPRKHNLSFAVALSHGTSFNAQNQTLEPLPHASSSKDQNQTLQALIIQACAKVENYSSCVSSIHNELESMGPRSPSSILTAALKTTLNEARIAVQMVTSLRAGLVLLEMKSIRAGSTNAQSEGNLKAWLSAALSNQDTCLEGFEGTDRRIESFIRGSLKQVTQLISNVLAMYVQLHSLPFKPPRNSTEKSPSQDFPKWMTDGDKDLLLAHPNQMGVDTIVSLDGSGHYRSIAQAIYEAPSYSNRRYIIYVKKGVYKENIDMKKKKTKIMIVGDGIGATVVTGNRNFMQGWTTFRTATVAVSGKGFIARDITFRNTAGPKNFQGVALRVDSDQSAFYRCSMEGYQDTLYAHSLRQFYRECDIHGTIDFIFWEWCSSPPELQDLHPKTIAPTEGHNHRTRPEKPRPEHWILHPRQLCLCHSTNLLGEAMEAVFKDCFLNTYMSSLVQPRGWLEWNGNFALGTLYYGEYRNYGPGALLSGRVQWPGYHKIQDTSVANFFTVGRFIDGLSWLPSTGVRFSAGLKN